MNLSDDRIRGKEPFLPIYIHIYIYLSLIERNVTIYGSTSTDEQIDQAIRVAFIGERAINREDLSQRRAYHRPKLETRSAGSNLFVVPLKGELFGFGRVEYRPICKNQGQS